MASVQIHLKPRPISPVHGHSKYLPFHWPSDFEYGPFFAEHATVPPDATEVYTLQSPALSASLSALFNTVIPGLDAEVPDPNRLCRSAWPALLQLAVTKLSLAFEFRTECENHIVRLFEGDRAPVPPPPSMRAPSLSPEWYAIIFSTGDRGDVELRGDESQDIELELFVWVYMQQAVDNYTHIWGCYRREMYQLIHMIAPVHLRTENSGLFNFLSRKAYALASIFTTETSADDSCPPLLSPSSSNGSSATDATDSSDSSHAGCLDEDANSSSLYRPFRRRNLAIVSESVDL
ncbi:uncharacterized protein EV420DRAFT_1646189 [Desarmillaria tabescens]|uniref:Uncharacterized protein n=1 Tax=Armillaria tabescens TaxID=1929756 RepID=A0AA39K0Z3_ARMTA|nr:uncharacterized protein EV420DRAFT_1646189 [Desarmillaria tabescens]KAK0451440.1 hypothetical protein EV420DRAFT_1646189 [Desarmillaria tabescens]